jgi:hypothetical protein
MPSVLTHNNWIIKWTATDPLQVVVYNRRNKDIKYYGNSDRTILTMLKDEPDRVFYSIEEDGEHMELTVQPENEERLIYALRVRRPPLAIF